MSTIDLIAMVITIEAVVIACVVSLIVMRAAATEPGLSSIATRTIISVWVWLILSVLLSLRGYFPGEGVFVEGDFLNLVILNLSLSGGLALAVLARTVSPQFRILMRAIPTSVLVGLQVYRVFGGIFWYYLAVGMLPFWIGISTGFLDVLVGIMALPVAYGLATKKSWSVPVAALWCVIGLTDFSNAIGAFFLAFLGVIESTPAPVLIGQHPLALITTFQVPLAMILHLMVLGRLRDSRSS